MMVSVKYGSIFGSLQEDGRVGETVALCLTYPLSIGMLKALAEKIADTANLKMKFYIEYLSIAFASLPYRTLFLSIPEIDVLFYLILIK